MRSKEKRVPGRAPCRPCGTNAPRVRGPAAGRSRRRGGGSGDRSRERVGGAGRPAARPSQNVLRPGRGRRTHRLGARADGAANETLARAAAGGSHLRRPRGSPGTAGRCRTPAPVRSPAQLSRPQEPPERQECLCYADEVTRVGAQTASEGARHPGRSNDRIRELGRLSTRTPGKRGGWRPWRWTKRPCLPPAPQGAAVRTLASAPFRAGGQHRDCTGGAQPPACPPDPGWRVPLQ